MRRLPAVFAALAALTIGLITIHSGAASRGRIAPLHPSHIALHALWTRAIQPNADSVPVYAPRVTLPGGAHRALVFVLAGNNSSNCSPSDPVRRATLYALDAASGAVRWSRSTSGPSRCTTAAPAVSGAWVYAAGLDGKVHRYAAATGRETHGRNWPRAITLMPDVEKVSANLTVGNGYVYATTSGFIGDQGHYQGHLVSIRLGTGRAHVFNTLCSTIHRLLGPTPSASNYCSAERSGLFGRGQGIVDPVNHDVYIVSGNGVWNGHSNWGDSLLKLNPSGSQLLDAFTPTNQADLDAQDADLGSTGPAILPAVNLNGHVYHLLVQGGKGPACGSCSGVALRLLDRDNLSGRGGPGHLGGDLADAQAPGGCEVLTAPAVWKSAGASWVFYANDCGLAAYRVAASGGTFRLDRVWSTGSGGTTPVLSGGVLYDAGKRSFSAYDPASGKLLWRGSMADVHWQYPLVAGRRLFIADQNGHVSAFSIAK